MHRSLLSAGLRAVSVAMAVCVAGSAHAVNVGSVEGGPLPQPMPTFPVTNWWNQDISLAPVDPNSSAYIDYINNGGDRHLHPDFGGEESPGSVAIYGFPYVVVDGTGASAPTKVAVDFHYSDQSDGVDHATDTSFAFYPIPPEAATDEHWVEGGEPGSVDQRTHADRHLLIIDRDNKYLYELYNVWYDGANWFGGSGAFFDMNRNDRRPKGWTSADAAGLAIFPGLVRYDEVYNAYGTNVTDIQHAFRVTVRATKGFVYPASHNAGSTAGALPMGARLRLKASKNISGFNPQMQKIFRAMKTYGLIVADNGSDMYISGTFDTNWDNDILNPAFGALSANDFEVIKLGWKPAVAGGPHVSGITVVPKTVYGGNGSTGTAKISDVAPAGGIVVALSATSIAGVPASVTIPSGATQATFPITTAATRDAKVANVTAIYAGQSKTTNLNINPASLYTLTANPTSVTGGTPATGNANLHGLAAGSGARITLSSSNTAVATVPTAVTVPGGSGAASFTITTKAVPAQTVVTITATYQGVSKMANLTVH